MGRPGGLRQAWTEAGADFANTKTPVVLPSPSHLSNTRQTYICSRHRRTSATSCRPSIFALASSTCRPPHSGGNNITNLRQPMLVSHFSTRFPARRSPTSQLIKLRSACLLPCTRLANASRFPSRHSNGPAAWNHEASVSFALILAQGRPLSTAWHREKYI